MIDFDNVEPGYRIRSVIVFGILAVVAVVHLAFLTMNVVNGPELVQNAKTHDWGAFPDLRICAMSDHKIFLAYYDATNYCVLKDSPNGRKQQFQVSVSKPKGWHDTCLMFHTSYFKPKFKDDVDDSVWVDLKVSYMLTPGPHPADFSPNLLVHAVNTWDEIIGLLGTVTQTVIRTPAVKPTFVIQKLRYVEPDGDQRTTIHVDSTEHWDVDDPLPPTHKVIGGTDYATNKLIANVSDPKDGRLYASYFKVLVVSAMGKSPAVQVQISVSKISQLLPILPWAGGWLALIFVVWSYIFPRKYPKSLAALTCERRTFLGNTVRHDPTRRDLEIEFERDLDEQGTQLAAREVMAVKKSEAVRGHLSTSSASDPLGRSGRSETEASVDQMRTDPLRPNNW